MGEPINLLRADMIGGYLPLPLHLQIPAKTTTFLPTPLNVARFKHDICGPHLRHKGLTTKLKRRDISLPHCIGISSGPEESHPHALSSVAAIADDFYSSLNTKNFKRLQNIISMDCVFEDLTFSKPFKKEEVHQFLKALTEAMGRDVKFVIDSMYEGKELSIAVRWHLEWQEKRIPLARGCTFYYCSTNNGKLQIEKACVFVESPIKPGEFVLELLKIIRSLFDKFPNQAKWFLDKPQALLQFTTKAYKLLIEPLILPLLVYYTHLWTYIAWILRYMLNLLQNLLRILW